MVYVCVSVSVSVARECLSAETGFQYCCNGCVHLPVAKEAESNCWSEY